MTGWVVVVHVVKITGLVVVVIGVKMTGLMVVVSGGYDGLGGCCQCGESDESDSWSQCGESEGFAGGCGQGGKKSRIWCQWSVPLK